jgi:hypothetical protein
MFIGGWWAAQLLVHRCVAYGATVLVSALDTPNPGEHGTVASHDQWLSLDRHAGGTGRVQLAPAEPANVVASVTQPVFHLHDTGPVTPDAPTKQPWHTRLVVQSRVTSTSHQALAGADLILTQRLEHRDAAMVGAALLLAPDLISRLTAMDNEMVAAFRGQAFRFIWLSPTAQEREIFG